MTLAELDKQLSDWRQLAETALNNTMEVYESPIYRALCDGKFTGETARRLGSPTRINKLVEQASFLKSFVDRAQGIRKDISLLNRNEKIAEIAALFTSPSITLEDEQTPLASRPLTAQAIVTRKCTPKELLEQLTSGFDLAKTLVSEIDSIQTTVLTKLDETARELESLRHRHSSPGDVAITQQKLAGLEGLVTTDPIGLQKNLDTEILPSLKAARDACEADERLRRQLDLDLAEAQALVQKLQAAHAEAAAQMADRKIKLTAKVAVPEALAEAELQKTVSWLFTLRQTAATVEWKCVTVGLQKWLSKTREQIAHEERAAAANRALLEKRLELRGLLGALQAKVAGEGRAEDKELFEVGEKARKLLHGRPTPMDEAEALVREYQKRSTGLT